MRTFVLFFALVGCGDKKSDAPAAAPPTPAPSPAPVATPPVAIADAAPAAAPAFLPARLDAKQGIVFADKPGGVVKGIPDGTSVAVVDVKDVGVGQMEDATLTVEHAGKKVALPADRVLVSGIVDAIHRSPDGKHAVFAPITACGDMCHTVLWIISASDGKRVKLGEGGPDVNVAWHPDGKTVAVGSGSLWLVSLADQKVTPMEGFTSPAYSPEGALYVRDPDGSAYLVAAGAPTKLWTAEKDPDAEEDEMSAEDPKPVEFENGKPDFELSYVPTPD